MQERTNRRKKIEYFFSGIHLNLDLLKNNIDNYNIEDNYLYKKDLPDNDEYHIPDYPKPKFHVSRLRHDTTADGLEGIREDGGFRDPYGGSLIWWSLAVGPEEIKDAETRLLKENFPDQMERHSDLQRHPEQQSFLRRFATSPAFEEKSRLGSFRFTFPLEDVLTAYREQFLEEEQTLVMRVYETVLYKQEVMYVVLVHSSKFDDDFKDYPLLEDDPEAICVYRDGCFIWRAQAMCETHWYKLNIREDRRQMEAEPVSRKPQFYVWDHVALAFHVENNEVLKFKDNELRQNLKYCEKVYPTLGTFTPLEEARELVSELWPLEVERALPPSYQEIKLVVAGSSGKEIRSTGNTILGEETFKDSEIKDKVVKVNNLKVRIINTPPLSELKDADGDWETNHQKEIRKKGPERQAFLLVIKLRDLTAKQVRRDVEEFERKFENDALRRTMIVFTHQERTKPKIQNLLLKLQEFLSQKVNSRSLVFHNKVNNNNLKKVPHLLNKVKNMIKSEFES